MLDPNALAPAIQALLTQGQPGLIAVVLVLVIYVIHTWLNRPKRNGVWTGSCSGQVTVVTT